MRAGLVVTVAVLVLAGSGQAAPSPPPAATPPVCGETTPPPAGQRTMTVGGLPVQVELARTEVGDPGLSGRPCLAPGTGMLFVADDPLPQGFWMKGMRFCLDLIWIDGGRIVGTTEHVCPEPPGTPEERLPLYFPPQPVRYVLEVPAGWLAEHGFGPGTPVTLPVDLATPTTG